MKKLTEKKLFFPIVTTGIFALFVYGAYALYYEFSSIANGAGSGVPYAIICSVGLGYIFMLFTNTFFGKHKAWIKNIIAFIIGNVVYHAALWGSDLKINPDGVLDSEIVLMHAYTIIFPVAAILLAASFIGLARKYWKVVNILLAVIYFSVSFGGFYNFNVERFNEINAKQDFYFDSISANDLLITKQEKDDCRKWYNENLIKNNGAKAFPFDFEIDGISLNDDLDNWEITVSDESKAGDIYKGGKTSYITLKHKLTKLIAEAETTIYEDNATCEWTVFIKNAGKQNSGVISEFYALDKGFETGKADLYYSNGSDDEPDDFVLNKRSVSLIPKTFNSKDGRPTDNYLSYFNVSGDNTGFVLGIGWSGLWEAVIGKDGENTSVTVKQENFEAYLLPNETVRSPLVSLSFYENHNALKGFNSFRKWVTDCVYPENIPDTITMMEVAGPHSISTADQIIDTLNSFGDDIYNNVDNFWMDAGWYKYNTGWHDGVGNWTPDTSRYDNGISELSSYAKTKDCGHVLWYEPERVMRDTILYNAGTENEQWLVDTGDDHVMWNLADDDAAKYLSEFMAKSLNENGVTVYRQDFNFSPDAYWAKADAEYYGGRTGIAENHYVTNLYGFLDYLCENVEGLVIDNCASGGRRLDLEFTRRSFPAWRSDYNCSYHFDIIESTQSQTYGISFWLPVTGTLAYRGSEYEARSSIIPCILETFATVQTEHFSKYAEQRGLMTQNYCPIENGGYSKNEIHAMQFSTADGTKGEALIYKRANVNDKEFTFKLNGLNPDEIYEIYDYDTPEIKTTYTGKELMEDGYKLSLPDGEKAIIIMFVQK